MSTESVPQARLVPAVADLGFRSIVEHSGDLVARLDRNGRHLYINPTAEKLTGIPVADWIGRTCREVPGMEDVAAFLEQRLDQVLDQGKVVEVEVEFPARKGDLCFHTRMVPEWGTQGQVETVLMLARDITERKQTEARLRESEERFRFLIEESRQVFFYVHDREHRFEYLSPSVEAVLGYRPEELIGRPYDQILSDGDTAGAVHQHTERALHGDGHAPPSTYIAPTLHRDGHVVVLELVEGGVDKDGRTVSLQGFARDVTRRVRDEEMKAFLSHASQVLASSLDYSKTLRAVARLVVPTLADWCVIDVLEEGVVRRVAAQHADASKQYLTDALLSYPPSLDAPLEGVPRVLRTGKSLRLTDVNADIVAQVAQNPGHRSTLEALGSESVMIVPLAHRGRTLGALTFVAAESGRRYTPFDLQTAERLALRASNAIENARLHRQAHEAIWSRQEILTVVSHDLRNPLSVIMNAAGLLMERSDDPALVKKYCTMIPEAARQMDRLVSDLLTASKMESGRFWVEPSPMDVESLVSDAVSLLHVLAGVHDVALVVDLETDLPRVLADERRVVQVFQNLVGNAIDLVPEGGEIRVSAARAGEFVEFAVSDDGPGVPPESLDHLFDRYYQVGGKDGGWGLGLAITKGIVEGHGGEIGVESTLGEGTTFRFTLPVA